MVNGKKPNKAEQKWINAIKEYGCCICKWYRGTYTPPEIHHTDGGNNHLSAIGLCFHDHREGSNTPEYVSRHPFKAEFEKRYGTEQELLDKLKAEIGE